MSLLSFLSELLHPHLTDVVLNTSCLACLFFVAVTVSSQFWKETIAGEWLNSIQQPVQAEFPHYTLCCFRAINVVVSHADRYCHYICLPTRYDWSTLFILIIILTTTATTTIMFTALPLPPYFLFLLALSLLQRTWWEVYMSSYAWSVCTETKYTYIHIRTHTRARRYTNRKFPTVFLKRDSFKGNGNESCQSQDAAHTGLSERIVPYRTERTFLQLKMVSMRSEKQIILCSPPRLSEVSPMFPFGTVAMLVWLTMALSTFQGRSSSASSFQPSRLQAIDGVMSLALCPQVVSQAPQHFRPSETQATCGGCFAR